MLLLVLSKFPSNSGICAKFPKVLEQIRLLPCISVRSCSFPKMNKKAQIGHPCQTLFSILVDIPKETVYFYQVSLMIETNSFGTLS